MSPPSTPPDPSRWARCWRCQHYRLEHVDERGPRGAGRVCLAVDPALPNPTPADRCACTGWQNPPPGRSPAPTA